jgi:hypothetical protein
MIATEALPVLLLGTLIVLVNPVIGMVRPADLELGEEPPAGIRKEQPAGIETEQPAPSVALMEKNGKFSLFGNFKRSCKEIKDSDPSATSGEYYIRSGLSLYLVFCEMGLNGGGYTFLHPQTIARMNDAQVQSIFNDKRSFLMRTQKSDSRQPYAVLKQHTSFSAYSLKVGLSQHTNYVDQAPLNNLGPYLFFGFIPRLTAANYGTQGININGQNLQFNNCDANGNSHIILYPNFDEMPYNVAHSTYPYTFSQEIFDRHLNNPSGRRMPVDYFMLAELVFGGCGAFSYTGNIHSSVVATTIGFR